ncbi:MAG TPA: 1-deoxy-D-xylulose-5-phosphate reductoisomerase [Syntrophales bacterium]|nr:1-deoxy-D-xylulose-5-phosphate reductoisomerase [Syntrophales bacterium]
MKNISILGSTGSIGVNALDVIRNNPDRFKIVALSACKNVELLRQQIETFKPKVVSVIDEEHAGKLKRIINTSIGTKILFGKDGYREVASIREADTVISAMVGSAGLLPTLEAIEAGKDIALANKEVMVMAGKIVVEKACEKGVRILPVDSEHSAIFQCINGHRREDIRRIILTASGGPFFHLSKEKLADVKPADALRHPNWQMGRKITIDSASMMNKGLEVIEASWLFSMPIDSIEVHIHPQSIVHSLVEYIDGSIIAQLGVPDMRLPIAYALSFPERFPRSGPFLDLLTVNAFEFYRPDMEKFPTLRLAYEAGKAGGTMPAVLNAANEIAVEAFLGETVKFTDISKIIEGVIAIHKPKDFPSLGEIFEADLWARESAKKIIERISILS